jgi:hypothetical protein
MKKTTIKLASLQAIRLASYQAASLESSFLPQTCTDECWTTAHLSPASLEHTGNTEEEDFTCNEFQRKIGIHCIAST